MAAISHIAAEDFDRAGLDPPAAGDEAQKRGFSDAVGAYQGNSFASWNGERDPIERDVSSIAKAAVAHARDKRIARHHGPGWPLSQAGHSTLGSTRT